MSAVEMEVDHPVSTFKDWLREARTRQGMTQVELMWESRVRESNISAYEKGTNDPSMEVFFQLVAALGEWPPMELAQAILTAKKEVRRTHNPCNDHDPSELDF